MSTKESPSNVFRSEDGAQPLRPSSKKFVIFHEGTLKAMSLFVAYLLYLTANGSITSTKDRAKLDLMTSQIEQLTKNLNEVEEVKNQHTLDEIKLGWDEQHIEELQGSVTNFNTLLKVATETTARVENESKRATSEYEAVQAENIRLKEELSAKIEALKKQPSSAPAPLRGSSAKHTAFVPGDVVEYVDESPFLVHPYYFRPALVIDAIYDDVTDTHRYKVVAIDHGKVVENVTSDKLSPYIPYGPDDDNVVPCASVYLRHMAKHVSIKSFHQEGEALVHGIYTFMVQDEERQISLKQMCRWKPDEGDVNV